MNAGMIDRSVLGPGMIGGIELWRKHCKEQLRTWRDDVLIISYPKSGRTWHRVLLAHYINTAFLKQEAKSIDVKKLTRKARLPLISYTHNGANFLNATPPKHPLNGAGSAWRRRKVILLTRDPRDVLLSAYMHARYRSGSFNGSLSDFIRHPFTGIEKFLIAHNRWASHMSIARSVLCQRYEDMHRDPAAVLKEALAFCNITIDHSAIHASVDFGKFENLKKMELIGFFEANAMRSQNHNDNAMKVRRGKIGSFRKHMSADDLAFINDAIRRIGYCF